MTTAVSAPNKANEDISIVGQVHADGAGHHMKTVAKKCNYSTFFFDAISHMVFVLFQRD